MIATFEDVMFDKVVVNVAFSSNRGILISAYL